MAPYLILIVDDDAPMLEALHEWFENLSGWPTVTVQSSDDALEFLARDSFDVVITGINQPGMTGIELTEIIKLQGGPPVIIYTGDATHENEELALKAGARAFLKKPLQLEALSAIVDQVVGGNAGFGGSAK